VLTPALRQTLLACFVDRKRWVMYKDTFDYSPSQIPPEWHGWINYVNDYTPHNHKFTKPIYALEAHQTKTGTDGAYQPKGTWTTQKKRNWVKYEVCPPRFSLDVLCITTYNSFHPNFQLVVPSINCPHCTAELSEVFSSLFRRWLLAIIHGTTVNHARARWICMQDSRYGLPLCM